MDSNVFILNCFYNYCNYVDPYITFMLHNILLIYILLFTILEVFVHITSEDIEEDNEEITYTVVPTHSTIALAAILLSIIIMTLPFAVPIIVISIWLANNKGVH